MPLRREHVVSIQHVAVLACAATVAPWFIFAILHGGNCDMINPRVKTGMRLFILSLCAQVWRLPPPTYRPTEEGLVSEVFLNLRSIRRGGKSFLW